MQELAPALSNSELFDSRVNVQAYYRPRVIFLKESFPREAGKYFPTVYKPLTQSECFVAV
jgi:hypothetical protein